MYNSSEYIAISNALKIENRCLYDVQKYSFSCTGYQYWNNLGLPSDIVNVPSVNLLKKSSLDKHWSNQDIAHNWHAKLFATSIGRRNLTFSAPVISNPLPLHLQSPAISRRLFPGRLKAGLLKHSRSQNYERSRLNWSELNVTDLATLL